ncbi:DUF92 domain-containing protein [Peribacillus deserti]|uniref:DUF92 domain-containing protein n=1 Tax=Peribacillus deserti TaxID=673318 RepID=A0A2N5M4D8_9BACI|nr:DUF92 domain-containing protein [Peribacillus deserti]PLT29195.1 DUF92 domain-containing protein [Peribacillus deserti]
MWNSILFLIIIFTAWAGWKQKSLTASGAFAAVIVGTATALGFGWKGLFVLGCFFASSSFWSKYRNAVKKPIDEKLMKGSQRDWQQVLANGGAVAIIACIHFIEPGNVTEILFLVSIAAANSDTWASELGVLSRSRPVSILNFKSVDKGTSGAVSIFGTFCALMASFFIAFISAFIFEGASISFVLMITGFGFLGSMYDTLIGALIQAEYKCTVCGLHTEKLMHCNESTQKVKGISLLNNDVVNALAIVLSVITCCLFI